VSGNNGAGINGTDGKESRSDTFSILWEWAFEVEFLGCS